MLYTEFNFKKYLKNPSLAQYRNGKKPDRIEFRKDDKVFPVVSYCDGEEIIHSAKGFFWHPEDPSFSYEGQDLILLVDQKELVKDAVKRAIREFKASLTIPNLQTA